MLTDVDWCWLILIDFDWLWLTLFDGSQSVTKGRYRAAKAAKKQDERISEYIRLKQYEYDMNEYSYWKILEYPNFWQSKYSLQPSLGVSKCCKISNLWQTKSLCDNDSGTDSKSWGALWKLEVIGRLELGALAPAWLIACPLLDKKDSCGNKQGLNKWMAKQV